MAIKKLIATTVSSQVDGDFPACMRRKKDNNDDNTKGKGGGRLKHYTVDGDVPLCLRKIDEESKDGSSSNKKNRKEKSVSESSTSKTSGCKDLCGDTTEKKNNTHARTKSKDITFIVLHKNMRSMHLSEPKGNEKHIDDILTKRRYLKYNKDAEANDMIHMGSDHRCVMATFMITTPEKSSHCKTNWKTRYNKA